MLLEIVRLKFIDIFNITYQYSNKQYYDKPTNMFGVLTYYTADCLF